MANDDVARVWDLMEKISFCMLATWNGSELRSRPMDARVRRKEGAIYFLTDARHLKDDEVAHYPKVNLAFADTGAMKYVSLSGEAFMYSMLATFCAFNLRGVDAFEANRMLRHSSYFAIGQQGELVD